MLNSAIMYDKAVKYMSFILLIWFHGNFHLILAIYAIFILKAKESNTFMSNPIYSYEDANFYRQIIFQYAPLLNRNVLTTISPLFISVTESVERACASELDCEAHSGHYLAAGRGGKQRQRWHVSLQNKRIDSEIREITKSHGHHASMSRGWQVTKMRFPVAQEHWHWTCKSVWPGLTDQVEAECNRFSNCDHWATCVRCPRKGKEIRAGNTLSTSSGRTVCSQIAFNLPG